HGGDQHHHPADHPPGLRLPTAPLPAPSRPPVTYRPTEATGAPDLRRRAYPPPQNPPAFRRRPGASSRALSPAVLQLIDRLDRRLLPARRPARRTAAAAYSRQRFTALSVRGFIRPAPPTSGGSLAGRMYPEPCSSGG